MILLVLLSCANHRVDALEAEVAALRTSQATQAANLAALQARVDGLTAIPSGLTEAMLQPPPTLVPILPWQGSDSAVLDDVQLTVAETAAFAAGALVEIRLVEHHGADGKADGIRISAVRSTSTAAVLHLKNGDVARAFHVGNREWTPITSLIGFGAFSQALVRPSAPVELLVSRRETLTVLRFTVAP